MARDWMRTLRPASFRGVTFQTEADTHDGGKRLGIHEYAGGYTSLIEEMGAITARFSVTAYLTTDAADVLAASLRAACMMPGPGLLRLPTEAARMVYVEEFSRLRERDRMGYIAFGFTAVPMGGVGAAPLGVGDLSAVFQSGFAEAASALQGLF